MSTGLAGLLLAAGGGRRLGLPKALVELGGEVLVERGVRMLVEGGCDPVVVVIGAAADDVLRRADLMDARVLVNHSWQDGMGSSLRAGLAELAELDPGLVPAPAAVVIALVDQPFVGSEVVRRLHRAWSEGAVAAAASFGGASRNPVLLDRSVWDAAAASAAGDRGARGFLAANPHLLVGVPCDDCARPDDIDTAADLAAARAWPEAPCGPDVGGD